MTVEIRNVSFRPEIRERIALIAKRDRRSFSNVVDLACEQYLLGLQRERENEPTECFSVFLVLSEQEMVDEAAVGDLDGWERVA